MSTLATIPSDVLHMLLLPEGSLNSSTVEMPLHRMIDLHVWRRRMHDVLYDLRRIRFFAYTSVFIWRSTAPLTHVRDDLLVIS